MGSWGLESRRPQCDRAGCSRRAYVVDEVHGCLCFVCDSTDRRDWAQRLWTGPAGRPRSSRLQTHLEDPHGGQITLLWLFGDGWSQQCCCARCEREWLNRGWICPAEFNRRAYLSELDLLYREGGFESWELVDVDWDAAVLALHEMLAGMVELDDRVLLGFAEASARVVGHGEAMLQAREAAERAVGGGTPEGRGNANGRHAGTVAARRRRHA